MQGGRERERERGYLGFPVFGSHNAKLGTKRRPHDVISIEQSLLLPLSGAHKAYLPHNAPDALHLEWWERWGGGWGMVDGGGGRGQVTADRPKIDIEID